MNRNIKNHNTALQKANSASLYFKALVPFNHNYFEPEEQCFLFFFFFFQGLV